MPKPTYLPWLASQREAGRTVVIDANLRPSVMPDLPAYRKHVLEALQYADVIKASDEDLACLDIPGSTALAQAAYLLRNSQAACVALTRGPDGATLLTRSGQVFHARESQPVVVVDTVGAGDCFLAGLVAALLDNGLASNWGEAPVEASLAKDLLSRAVASASLCIMQRGCVPPTRDEVQVRRSASVCEFTQDATGWPEASV
jgi:fructokinase